MQVRKKAMQQQAQQNLQDCKSHCTSEPRLNETETPQTHRRYGSTRRATHNSGEYFTKIYVFFLNMPCASVKYKVIRKGIQTRVWEA